MFGVQTFYTFAILVGFHISNRLSTVKVVTLCLHGNPLSDKAFNLYILTV